MNMQFVYAAIPVADMDNALVWYGKLFGRQCDDRPMQSVAEWQLTNGGGVQLVHDAKRAGKSMLTLDVQDLTQLIADCKTRGITAHPTGPNQGPYDLAQVKDPDGNLLTFAQPKMKH
ncbi:MAG: VOC family protein [Polyangiales bacterium]